MTTMNAMLTSESRTNSTISCASLATALPPPTTAALTSVVSMPRMGVEFKDRIFVGGFPPGVNLKISYFITSNVIMDFRRQMQS